MKTEEYKISENAKEWKNISVDDDFDNNIFDFVMEEKFKLLNYTYEYNGEKYNLTGGFQGGKGSFTKTNIYIRPFDCYSKVTVTVLFDSSSADRKVRVSQEDGTKNGIILGEAGGAGNRNIVALTVETTDLTKPIYIMPLTKESIYTVIVDYED